MPVHVPQVLHGNHVRASRILTQDLGFMSHNLAPCTKYPKIFFFSLVRRFVVLTDLAVIFLLDTPSKIRVNVLPLLQSPLDRQHFQEIQRKSN